MEIEMAYAKSRFFLAQDYDCHWYLIDASYRDHWYNWLESGSEDVPEFVIAIDGSPQWVEFENPEFK